MYNMKRTGHRITPQDGVIYTSPEMRNALEKQSRYYTHEQAMLKEFAKGKRVTPDEAYRRYQLIKQGKDNQLYSAKTLRKLKRTHGDKWEMVAAMDLDGLKGGGIETLLGAAVPLIIHKLSKGRTPVSIGVDHRGNVAVGPGPKSVSYQLKQQRKQQDKHESGIKDLEKSTVEREVEKIHKRKKTAYEGAVESTENHIRLINELQRIYKPRDTYAPKYHKFRPNPLTQIHNAYNMHIDTSQWLSNRDNFSRLYKSLKNACIQHQDILNIWGNPYIGTVTKWNELSYQRRQNILKDYPNTDGIANRISEAKRALTYELATADYETKQFIHDFVIVGLSVWAEKRFKVPNTLMAPVYATRMECAFAYIQPKYEKNRIQTLR